jgi:nucleotide-binding universal stress UspA family protein
MTVLPADATPLFYHCSSGYNEAHSLLSGETKMLQIHRILAPVEFDDLIDDVARTAVQLATLFKARVSFLHVDDPLAGAPSLVAGSIHTPRHTEDDLRERILEFVPVELLSLVSASYHVASGEPVEEIVRFSRKNGVDLIVLGNTAKSAFARLFFTSIEEAVIHKAPCHVLTVVEKRK